MSNHGRHHQRVSFRRRDRYGSTSCSSSRCSTPSLGLRKRMINWKAENLRVCRPGIMILGRMINCPTTGFARGMGHSIDSLKAVLCSSRLFKFTARVSILISTLSFITTIPSIRLPTVVLPGDLGLVNTCLILWLLTIWHTMGTTKIPVGKRLRGAQHDGFCWQPTILSLAHIHTTIIPLLELGCSWFFQWDLEVHLFHSNSK